MRRRAAALSLQQADQGLADDIVPLIKNTPGVDANDISFA
jgi:hypothetical protein